MTLSEEVRNAKLRIEFLIAEADKQLEEIEQTKRNSRRKIYNSLKTFKEKKQYYEALKQLDKI